MAPTRNTVSKEMVKKIAEKANITKNVTNTDINEICNTLFDVMIETLKQKDAVMINNMMKIKKVWRKERAYKNPKTGAESVKDAHFAVTISAMPGLKKLVGGFEENSASVDDSANEKSDEEETTGTVTSDEEPVVEKKKAPVKKAPTKTVFQPFVWRHHRRALGAEAAKGIDAKKVVEVEMDNSDSDSD